MFTLLSLASLWNHLHLIILLWIHVALITFTFIRCFALIADKYLWAHVGLIVHAPLSQGRRHQVSTGETDSDWGGGGGRVQFSQNHLPPNSDFSSDIAHFILEILEILKKW